MDFEGIDGETAWMLVTDHFTGVMHGDTRISKAAPMLWLKHFLAQHNPPCKDECVHMDQGGELFRMKSPVIGRSCHHHHHVARFGAMVGKVDVAQTQVRRTWQDLKTSALACDMRSFLNIVTDAPEVQRKRCDHGLRSNLTLLSATVC